VRAVLQSKPERLRGRTRPVHAICRRRLRAHAAFFRRRALL